MKHKHSSQSGMTLIEVIVVMAIALVIIMASFRMLEETARVTLFIETRNDLPIIAQSAVNNIQTAVSQARQIFDSDATGIGPGYLNALSVPVTKLTDSRMPLTKNGAFTADVSGGPAYTGNSLLIARQLEAITVPYTGGSLDVDRYRFEYFFLTKGTNWKFVKYTGYIDAMRAHSAVYADYFQLSSVTVTPAQRLEINNYLRANGIMLAWNPGQPINASVYNVTTNGASVAVAYTLNNSPTISMPTVKSLTPQINGGRIFGKANYSIAFQPTAVDKYPLNIPVARYAHWDSAKPLFPSGLEFVIVGNANTRRVLTRMSVMAHYRANEYASQEVSVITAP